MKLRDITEPVVMAIVNATPDSFYSGSRNESDEKLRQTIEKAIEDGASIIDIGGYSSRPGADEVTVNEEIERVVNAVRIVRTIDEKIAISIDTFRSEVIRSVVEVVGTVIVNDISTGKMDDKMIATVAELKLSYIAMHMRGTPKTMQQMCEYNDITASVFSYFIDKIVQLRQAGINDLAIDPGFGFAKDTDQNFQLLANMHKLSYFGLPILAGISRKSMIYKTLDITPEESLNGTSVINWEALWQGAKILRVHDVREAMQTIKLFNKVRQYI